MTRGRNTILLLNVERCTCEYGFTVASEGLSIQLMSRRGRGAGDLPTAQSLKRHAYTNEYNSKANSQSLSLLLPSSSLCRSSSVELSSSLSSVFLLTVPPLIIAICPANESSSGSDMSSSSAGCSVSNNAGSSILS